MLKVAALLIFSSCGLTIEHKITGRLSVELDLERLSDYFVPVCLEEMPDASEEELQLCVDAKVGYFLQAVINES